MDTPTALDTSCAEPVSAVLLLQIKVDANVDAEDFSTPGEMVQRLTMWRRLVGWQNASLRRRTAADELIARNQVTETLETFRRMATYQCVGKPDPGIGVPPPSGTVPLSPLTSR